MTLNQRLPYVWDYDIDEAQFQELLAGQRTYCLAFGAKRGRYDAHVLPGFWLQVECLWRDPLPSLARMAWQIAGVEALRQLLAELDQQVSG